MLILQVIRASHSAPVFCICYKTRGVTRGERGAQCPDAETLGDDEQFQQCRKCFYQHSTLTSKRPQFEHGGAKLVSCPRRHLTSVRPCIRPHLILDRTNSLNGSWCTRCRTMLADWMPNGTFWLTDRCQAKFLTSRHVRMHRVIF